MGETGRINAALAIISVTGGLVIYSAVEKDFKVPAEVWGLGMAAATYLFSSGRADDKKEYRNGSNRRKRHHSSDTKRGNPDE